MHWGLKVFSLSFWKFLPFVCLLLAISIIFVPLYLISLFLSDEKDQENNEIKRPPAYMRWPHMKANQVHGLGLREIGGGFTRHHRAPSVRAASYAIAKPSTMFQKMKNTKRLRGHRNAVYCGMFSFLRVHILLRSIWKLILRIFTNI